MNYNRYNVIILSVAVMSRNEKSKEDGSNEAYSIRFGNE